MPRVLISAGEASGDALGAELVTCLRERRSDLVFSGLGGPRLAAAGLCSVASLPAGIGVAEALRRVPAAIEARRALVAGLAGQDLVVTIDSPALNLGMARAARKMGIPAVHWVCPQVWAWRPGRVDSIARSVDQLLCLFDFEPTLFARTGLRAVWVGHPAVDRVCPRRPERNCFGLLPGSRRSEVDALRPVFLRVAERLRADGARVLVGRAPTVSREACLGLGEVVEGIDPLRARCEAVITASGTATLELALSGVPQVVVYRVHPLTLAIGRHLVRGVSHLALPNVLAGRAVVPEFVQDLDSDELVAALRSAVATTPDYRASRAAAGPSGATARAADHVLSWL